MTTKFKHQDEVEKVLEQSGVEKNDICLVGGISLFIAGIREHNDVDFCIKPEIKKQLVIRMKSNGYDTSETTGIKFSKNVEANRGNIYRELGISDDDLINNPKYHIRFNDFKVVKLELQYARKLYRCTKIRLFRLKDLKDIILIENYIKSTNKWDKDLVVFPDRSFMFKLSIFSVKKLSRIYGLYSATFTR